MLIELTITFNDIKLNTTTPDFFDSKISFRNIIKGIFYGIIFVTVIAVMAILLLFIFSDTGGTV